MNHEQPQLLVSVRNTAEATAAIEGGADLLDVKEPTAGALGPAGAATQQRVVEAAGEAQPVTAALGEWADGLPERVSPGLRFVKCGLAGAPADWGEQLIRWVDRYAGRERFVVAAYADHSRVGGPGVEPVVAWAIEQRVAGVLIDTAVKDGRGLLSWCEEAALREWAEQLRATGGMLALAGSLGETDVAACAALEPAVVAVRGAACAGGDRSGSIDPHRVRRLRRAVQACSAAAGGREG